MWYWNSEEMARCRDMLQDGGNAGLGLAQECIEELKDSMLSAEDYKCLSSLAESLVNAAKFEKKLAESILRIDRIYSRNEERIRDYFDLAVQIAPHTELGISTFESLNGHEDQMPFERRQE